VNFDGATFLSGDLELAGAYDGNVPQGAVTYANNGMFSQTGGTLSIEDAFFRNRSQYTVFGRASITNPGSAVPPGAPLPGFGFLNEVGATFAAGPGLTSSGSLSFVERIENRGTVLLSGDAYVLELGGGRHREGVFDAGAIGLLAYSGTHAVVEGPKGGSGETVFRGQHVLLGDDPSSSFKRGPGAGRLLVDNEGHAFVRDGTLTAKSASRIDVDWGSLTIDANAQIAMEQGSALAVKKDGTLTIAGRLHREGQTSPGAGPTLTNAGTVIVTGQVTGAGVLENAAGSTLQVDTGGVLLARSVQSSGTVIVNGRIDTTGGAVSLDGSASLYGSGEINGDLNMGFGALGGNPRVFPGNSPGTLTVNGAFTMVSGELVLEIDRDASGQLVSDRIVADQIRLAGGLVRFQIGAAVGTGPSVPSELFGLRFFDCGGIPMPG